MSKSKSKNAFYFFMVDWKKRAEAQGHTFPNGLKDVQADSDCNEEWKSLTKQQKDPYESMAKDHKITSQISKKDKQTTFGESIKMLEQRETEERKFIADMHKYLKSTITVAVNHNILPQLSFCLVHVNWFFKMCVSNTIQYFPAEYAVGIFSLEKGIISMHHEIVSAPIPLGFRREAIETSQNLHQIPIEFKCGKTDFAAMYEGLVKFLEPWKIAHKYPPFFTTKPFKGAVQSLLARLSDAAQQDEKQFLVYEIESLFKHLADEAYKKRTDRELKYTPAYAEYAFTDYKYMYKRGNECSFHRFVDGGSEHCSKSVLHQWTWRMCEEFCDALEINMEPGVHFPKADPSLSGLTESMAKLNTKREISKDTVEVSVASMTGVSEQHRVKVSERTHEEEMRRRKECKPVQVIDLSKSDESDNDKPIDKSVDKRDKSIDKLVDKPRKKYVPNYLSERRLRPPNIASCVVATIDDYVPKNDEKNFPPIGGRGVFSRDAPVEKRKAPLGRGRGHA